MPDQLTATKMTKLNRCDLEFRKMTQDLTSRLLTWHFNQSGCVLGIISEQWCQEKLLSPGLSQLT